MIIAFGVARASKVVGGISQETRIKALAPAGAERLMNIGATRGGQHAVLVQKRSFSILDHSNVETQIQ